MNTARTAATATITAFVCAAMLAGPPISAAAAANAGTSAGRRIATVFGAALTGAGTVPTTPVRATVPPAYTCDGLMGDPTTTRIYGHCEASLGAVRNGRFGGESILMSRRHPTRVRCTGGGVAKVPLDVIGNNCARVP